MCIRDRSDNIYGLLVKFVWFRCFFNQLLYRHGRTSLVKTFCSCCWFWAQSNQLLPPLPSWATLSCFIGGQFLFFFVCLFVFFARMRHHFLCNIRHFGNEKATVWYWGWAGQVLAIFCPIQVILLFTSSSLSRKDQFAVLYFLHVTVSGVCESWLGPVSFSAFLKRRMLVLHLSFLQGFMTFYLS